MSFMLIALLLCAVTQHAFQKSVKTRAECKLKKNQQAIFLT